MTGPRRNPPEATDEHGMSTRKNPQPFNAPEATLNLGSPAQSNQRRDVRAGESPASSRNVPPNQGADLEITRRGLDHGVDRPQELVVVLSQIVESILLKQKRDSFLSQLQAVRAERDKVHRHPHFQLAAEDASQHVKRIETLYEAVEKETREQVAAANAATQVFEKLLFNIHAKSLEQTNSTSAQLRSFQEDWERSCLQQTSINDSGQKTASAAAALTDENEQLKKRLHSLETNSSSLEKEVQALRVLRIQDAVAMQKQSNDIRAELNRELQSVRDDFKSNEQSQETLRKSGQLKLKNTQDELEAFKIQVTAREKVCKAEMSKLVEGCTNQETEAGIVKQDVTALRKVVEDRGGDVNSLLQSLESEVADLKSNLASFPAPSSTDGNVIPPYEALRKEMKEELAKLSEDCVRAHDRQSILVSDARRMQNEVTAQARSLHEPLAAMGNHLATQRPAPECSNGNLDAVLPKVDEMEKDIQKLQRDREILTHHVDWLNHRFNNLNTTQLAEYMIGVLAPRFSRLQQAEKKIQQLDTDMQQIQSRQKSSAPGQMAAKGEEGDESTHTDPKFPNAAAEKLQAQLSSLTARSEEIRQNVMTNLNELHLAQCRSSNEQSAHRALTDKRLDELRSKAEEMQTRMEELDRVHKGGQTEPPSPGPREASRPSPHPLSAVTADRPPSTTQQPKHRPRAEGITRLIDSDEDGLSAEEAETRLLAQPQMRRRPRNSARRSVTTTPKPQAAAQPSSKRKRSERMDADDSLDPNSCITIATPPTQKLRRG